MSNAVNEATVRRVFDEIASRGAYHVTAEIYAPDFVDHDPLPGAPDGPAAARYSIEGFRRAMPDLTVTVNDMSSHGDKVATHNTWQGTHTGEILGIAPTGRVLTFSGVVVFRFADDGRIAERWAIGVDLDLWRELGLKFPLLPRARSDAARRRRRPGPGPDAGDRVAARPAPD